MEPTNAKRHPIPNDKSVIIILENKKETWLLIDVAIPGDRNVIKKEDEKILKYKNLTKERNNTKNAKTN